MARTTSAAGATGLPWRRLLLPRNRSVWIKWVWLPLGAAVAVAASGRPPSLRTVLEVVVVWVVAEHLAYQARYLANDLRDRAADEAHPAAAQRRRLPGGLTRGQVRVLWGSVAFRVLLAVVVPLLVLTGPARTAALAFLAGLAVVTAVYEVGRDRVRRRAVRPGAPGALGLALPVLAGVPLGYGLRVGAGYHAAAADGLDGVGVLLVLTVLLLQTAGVLLAWTLEGTAFLDAFPRAHRYDPGLERLAHVGLLLVHAGALDRSARPRAGPSLGDAPTEVVVARDRPAQHGSRALVWDAAAALAAVGAVLTVAAGAGTRAAWWALLPAALLLASAPWVARAVVARGGGTGGTWLGGGALAVAVRLEAVVLLAVVVVTALLAPHAVWLLVVPVVTTSQWAALRASSWAQGVGPRTVARAVLARAGRVRGAGRGRSAAERVDLVVDRRGDAGRVDVEAGVDGDTDGEGPGVAEQADAEPDPADRGDPERDVLDLAGAHGQACAGAGHVGDDRAGAASEQTRGQPPDG